MRLISLHLIYHISGRINEVCFILKFFAYNLLFTHNLSSQPRKVDPALALRPSGGRGDPT
jgi:hypothetical protein